MNISINLFEGYNLHRIIGIGAKRSEKKNTNNLNTHRPVTAISTISRSKLAPPSIIQGISITTPNWKPGHRYTTIKSSRSKRITKPLEATSSFWDDAFSFNNKTIGSQTSFDRPLSTERARNHKIIKLVRKGSTIIGKSTIIHHGNIQLTLHELQDVFKLRHEQRNEPPIDNVIFRLGNEENCPQINCNIMGPGSKQVGRFIIKKNLGTMNSQGIKERLENVLTKNLLAGLDFHDITIAEMNKKPTLKIQIGSKMGLRGWNSIKNILKYGEFEFSIDFSVHRSFDRIRLSDQGVKEFMYGIENSTSLIRLNIKENNITAIGMEVIKNYLPRTKIKYLNISHNPLGNEGIKILSKLLMKYNYVLFELDISS